MASHCQNMLELIYVRNGILQNMYDWWHIDCNNMYSMIYIKFASLTFTILINEEVQIKQH